MALINPTLPTIGAPNSTEDADILAAFQALVGVINGGVDTTNLAASAGITGAQIAAAAGIAEGQLNDTLVARLGLGPGRGKAVIAGSESTASTSYTLLATPDRVSGIVLPTDGLIFVVYRANMVGAVGPSVANAAIFLGSNQLKGSTGSATTPSVQEAMHNDGAVNHYLHTAPGGLRAHDSIAGWSNVTTGQIVGQNQATSPSSAKIAAPAGVCIIEAAAGTYDVSVKFKTDVGTVAASDRKLRVWTMGF